MVIDKNESKIYKEIRVLFEDFEEQLLHENRYTLQHDFVKLFKNQFDKNNIFTPCIELKKNKTIIYRARLYENDETEEEIKAKPPEFIGYNKEKSFVPPKEKCKMGRINPEGIVYLYATKDLKTAIKEVRPYLRQVVSVAKVKVNNALKLIDLTSKYNTKNACTYMEAIRDLLSELLSVPVRPDENKKYLATQYIAEIIKDMGFDGIAYRSAFDIEEINYCIFNYKECDIISSNKYMPLRIAMRYKIYGKISIFEDILSSTKNLLKSLFFIF